jgi:hypothetical protein
VGAPVLPAPTALASAWLQGQEAAANATGLPTEAAVQPAAGGESGVAAHDAVFASAGWMTFGGDADLTLSV